MSRKPLLGTPGNATDEVMARMFDLSPNAEEFVALSEGIRALSEKTPNRISLRQALAFLYVVQARARGMSITMSQVREHFDGLPGEANVGLSMAKSFQLFFGPQNEYAEGLDWVYQSTDREDRRKKILNLTAHGAEAANDIIAAMEIGRETYREWKKTKLKEARKED